jgi:hypothetical protein
MRQVARSRPRTVVEQDKNYSMGSTHPATQRSDLGHSSMRREAEGGNMDGALQDSHPAYEPPVVRDLGTVGELTQTFDKRWGGSDGWQFMGIQRPRAHGFTVTAQRYEETSAGS